MSERRKWGEMVIRAGREELELLGKDICFTGLRLLNEVSGRKRRAG